MAQKDDQMKNYFILKLRHANFFNYGQFCDKFNVILVKFPYKRYEFTK